MRRKSKPKKLESIAPKKFSWALWALAALALILIIGRIFIVLTSFYNPVTVEYQSTRPFRWQGQYTLNVAVKAKTLSLVSFDPASKTATIIKIPDNSMLDVPKGYGLWPARSIYDLGQQESPPIGDKLVKSSLTQLLGVPIDGFVLIGGKGTSKDVADIISEIHANPLAILGYLGSVKSDLTGFELLQFAQKVTSVRADELTSLDLENSNITNSQLLPDSTRVLGVDTVQLDLFIRKNLKESVLANFDGSIAIFNATIHPGLATEVARIITNMGGDVITTANTETNIEKTVVFETDSSVPTDALIRLKQIFAPGCLKEKCANSDPKVSLSRANINIVIGEDYFLRKTDRNFSF